MQGRETEMMQKRKWKNPVMLALAAAIWGFAFVSQSVGMEYVGPFTFNSIRNIMGALVLVPVILIGEKWEKKAGGDLEKTKAQADLLIGGLCCGVVLFISTSAQQIGIKYTTVGKAGFITALYIVIVPVVSLVFGKKSRPAVWISIILAVAGFYFLTMVGESAFTKGDAYVLVSAFTFTGHILCVDYFAPKVNGVKLSCLQFLVCGILSGIIMFIAENPNIQDIFRARLPLLYAGVLSCGVAYTLQVVGQKNYNPAIAALIMSLESVFSVLAGWMILGQTLSVFEALGCVLIFSGIILTQLPEEWLHRR